MLLIGIKDVNESGSFHGAEGFEGISVNASKFDILAQGTKKELRAYVKKARAEAKTSSKRLEKISDLKDMTAFSNDDSGEHYEQLEKEEDLLLPKLNITHYLNLIIIEGETV